MKTMKKALSILMILVLALSLVACGTDDGKTNGDSTDPVDAGVETKDSIAEVAATYGLNLESTDQQPMSEERATTAQLYSVMHDYLNGVTLFGYDPAEKITYADLKEQIGVDATTYYAEGTIKQSFVWEASDNSTAKFLATFVDGLLYGTGSANLS